MFTAADPGVIKGGAPVYGVGTCAPQKLKQICRTQYLEWFRSNCFLCGLYIDQELYRVTIMPVDYYYHYRPKEWHTQARMHFICKISLAG